MLATVAVVAMWPDTLWPPISSPTLAERSKLIGLPVCKVPRLVARRVSTITSKDRTSPAMSVTCTCAAQPCKIYAFQKGDS